jgi:class 3 adenylate cyclase
MGPQSTQSRRRQVHRGFPVIAHEPKIEGRQRCTSTSALATGTADVSEGTQAQVDRRLPIAHTKPEPPAKEGTLNGERVERRLAAILAADVAGYSRLMGQDEAGTLGRREPTAANSLIP